MAEPDVSELGVLSEVLRKELQSCWYALSEERREHYLDQLVGALRVCGVESATLEYDGSGDSGSVEDPEYSPSGAKVPAELSQALVHWVEGCLPGGWEINEGSSGGVTLTVDPPAGEPRARFGHRWDLDFYESNPFVEPSGPNADDLDFDFLCAEMAESGVVRAVVTYSGFGDEGAVDDVAFEGVEGKDFSRFEERLSDWVCDKLPSGWGDNEGSRGTVTVDVAGRRAEFDHEDRYRDSEGEDFEVD